MLLNELETVQEEAKEAVNKKAKERAQVFFIGEQSTENPEIFVSVKPMPSVTPAPCRLN